MKKNLGILLSALLLIFFFSCQPEGLDFQPEGLALGYDCDGYNCFESESGDYLSLEECDLFCQPKPNKTNVIITAFLYENCPIAQYMCGPLRETYRYFCDTLNQNFIFRGFSPNAFSTTGSLNDFMDKYDIPFSVTWDYNELNGSPGAYTQNYLPIVTPEVFIEKDGTLIYRGMIDNSYQALGDWSLPTEHYLKDVLMNIVNKEEIVYFETEAIGCFINY